VAGSQQLAKVAQQSIQNRQRLFGFYGVTNGHLPFQTADGQYDPTVGVRRTSADQTVTAAAEKYSDADIEENPTLSQMTSAALDVLASRSDRL
jgi:alkaline phosphatase